MALRIYGNRQLKTLPGRETRPTPARVREALFNIWQGSIPGCRWLDLCTGTGAMGAEALCRGATSAVGIEQSGRACGVIQQNWRQVATAEQQFQVMRGNVIHLLPKLAGQRFDRIYFDPPYASDLYDPVLAAIAQHQLLAVGGELAVEHDRGRSLPSCWEPFQDQNRSPLALPSLAVCREKTYGTTALTFYYPVYDSGA